MLLHGREISRGGSGNRKFLLIPLGLHYRGQLILVFVYNIYFKLLFIHNPSSNEELFPGLFSEIGFLGALRPELSGFIAKCAHHPMFAEIKGNQRIVFREGANPGLVGRNWISRKSLATAALRWPPGTIGGRATTRSPPSPQPPAIPARLKK